MLSDSQIRSIQAEKTRNAFSTRFILDFDSNWNMAVARLKSSGVDLAKVGLVAVHREYKNVRT